MLSNILDKLLTPDTPLIRAIRILLDLPTAEHVSEGNLIVSSYFSDLDTERQCPLKFLPKAKNVANQKKNELQ